MGCIKNFYNSTVQRLISQLNLGKEFEQTFFPKNIIEMANKHMKKMFNIISH